jgi:hypothetical protein
MKLSVDIVDKIRYWGRFYELVSAVIYEQN